MKLLNLLNKNSNEYRIKSYLENTINDTDVKFTVTTNDISGCMFLKFTVGLVQGTYVISYSPYVKRYSLEIDMKGYRKTLMAVNNFDQILEKIVALHI